MKVTHNPDTDRLTHLRNIERRLGEAKIADRKLDAEIDSIAYGGVPSHTFDDYRASYSDGAIFIGRSCFRHAPIYTASIDAAVALAERVLGTDAIDIECAKRYVAGKPYGRAEICGPHIDTGVVQAASPAIALCIAVVRAMIAIECDKENADHG